MALDTEKLRHLRQQKGWSGSRTAREAGINQSYYSQLERGYKTHPSDNVTRRLAAAFGVTPEELAA